MALGLGRAARAAGLVFVDATGARLERLAQVAAALSPGVAVLALPAWDSAPWDRTPASAAIVGQRVQALAALAAGQGGPTLVLTTARAALQRVPAPAHWEGAALTLRPGDPVDETALCERLAAFGYGFDERVDRPGEVALRGQVIDLFPGGDAAPVRIEVADGAIAALHRFDPVDQRTREALEALVLRPVVEAEPAPERVAAEARRMADGDDEAEHEAAPAATPAAGQLEASLFDYLDGFRAVLHPDVPERIDDIAAELEETHEAAVAAARGAGRGAVVPPRSAFYLDAGTVKAGLEALPRGRVETAADALPMAVDGPALVAQVRAATGRVLLAAGPAAAVLRRSLARRKLEAECLDVTIPEGIRTGDLTLLAVPPAIVRPQTASASGLPLEEPPRLSDIVVHEEHGVCRLSGLRAVGAEERLALAFHEGTELLVPIGDLARLWRYGSEAGGVGLDRLHGDAWRARRAEIEAEVEDTARKLAEAAERRAATPAPAIALPEGTPERAFRRVVERFGYAPSADQAAAIEAVLADLGAGRPMDRLVCGDVGFGKTEVAVRAAALAALAGFQVAIVAPTTVLARQHLETFRRRMAGTGIRVEPLLRGAAGAGAKAVRDGLASGAVGIVVGTQAIASDSVRFQRLGLVVIDEEQRFGDADKRKLSALGSRDGAVHVLVMTATPIPRTLQAAMVGLRDISVIATAPVRRQPTRTFVLPWTEAVVREALGRERARGGQSFVVVPRIESLGAVEAALRGWVPELSLAVAHGRLKPAALEAAVAGFAAGETDVLLATNIIEAGLDIPRANTILITGPHRFGLAQLHQMRGRVGRGERRGTAYVLTDPEVRLAGPTVRRLETLEMLEGLGAGVSLAMADMDTRGAGDLFGEEQAGHVHAIGTELYQHILSRALAGIEGRPFPNPAPELHLAAEGRIPEEYVPEANLRLALYRRLARVATVAEADDLAEEFADRFGPVPEALAPLLDAARLRAWCRGAGVVRVDAGPKATALTVADPAALAERLGGTVKDERVLLPVGVGAAGMEGLLATLGAG